MVSDQQAISFETSHPIYLETVRVSRQPKISGSRGESRRTGEILRTSVYRYLILRYEIYPKYFVVKTCT